jgi:hypothetical protein
MESLRDCNHAPVISGDAGFSGIMGIPRIILFYDPPGYPAEVSANPDRIPLGDFAALDTNGDFLYPFWDFC